MSRVSLFRLFAALPLALALVTAAPAAEDPPESDIGPAEWRRMVLGQNVTYLIGGQFWAQEYYACEGNRVSIRLVDGTRMDGVWRHDGTAFCFDWEDAYSSCFRHVRTPAAILILPIVDGEVAGSIQTVGDIDSGGLPCAEHLGS